MSQVHPLDEREMVASWGYDVRWIGGIGNYLGEWMALLRDTDTDTDTDTGTDTGTDRWGLLWIGHTSSTDRDEYELTLPPCPWECRSSPSCPHDWSAIETMSRLQRDSIIWADRAGLAARLTEIRATWDGPSSQTSAERAIDAILSRLNESPRP